MIRVRNATVHATKRDVGRRSQIRGPGPPAGRAANGSRNSASGRRVSRARWYAIQKAVSETSCMGEFRLFRSLCAGSRCRNHTPGQVRWGRAASAPQSGEIGYIHVLTALPADGGYSSWARDCSRQRWRRRGSGGYRRSGRRLGLAKLHPRGRVVAGLLPAAYLALDAGGLQAARSRGIQQQVIDAQAGIAPVGIAKKIPERKNRLVRVEKSNRVGPS